MAVVDETSGAKESIILSGRYFCWFLCKLVVVFTKSLGILLSYAIFEIRRLLFEWKHLFSCHFHFSLTVKTLSTRMLHAYLICDQNLVTVPLCIM